MDRPGGHILSERNQTEKDKYCLLSLIRGIYNSQTHRSRVDRWYLGAGGGGKGKMVVKGQGSKCQLHKMRRSSGPNVQQCEYS